MSYAIVMVPDCVQSGVVIHGSTFAELLVNSIHPERSIISITSLPFQRQVFMACGNDTEGLMVALEFKINERDCVVSATSETMNLFVRGNEPQTIRACPQDGGNKLLIIIKHWSDLFSICHLTLPTNNSTDRQTQRRRWLCFRWGGGAGVTHHGGHLTVGERVTVGTELQDWSRSPGMSN